MIYDSGRNQALQTPWDRFNDLTHPEQLVVEALKGVESQQQELRFQYQLELLTLKQKYAGLLTPLYERRKSLVTGRSTPSDRELDAGERGLQKVLGKGFSPPTRRLERPARLDNFWLTAWMNHPGLSRIVTFRDQEVFTYLADIRVTYMDDPAKHVSQLDYAGVAAGKRATPADNRSEGFHNIGYTLLFDFEPNPFFENETLEKTYLYKRGEVDLYGEFLYAKSFGCTIDWKDGQNLIGGDDDDADMSFFTFFTPTSLPSDAEAEKLTEDEFSVLLEEVEGDFACGEDIRDEIIPYSLMYLLDPPIDEDSDDDSDGSER